MNYSVENLHTFCEIARPSYTLVLLVKPIGAQSQFKRWNFAVSRIKMRGHQQYICGGKARNGDKIFWKYWTRPIFQIDGLHISWVIMAQQSVMPIKEEVLPNILHQSFWRNVTYKQACRRKFLQIVTEILNIHPFLFAVLEFTSLIFRQTTSALPSLSPSLVV